MANQKLALPQTKWQIDAFWAKNRRKSESTLVLRKKNLREIWSLHGRTWAARWEMIYWVCTYYYRYYLSPKSFLFHLAFWCALLTMIFHSIFNFKDKLFYFPPCSLINFISAFDLQALRVTEAIEMSFIGILLWRYFYFYQRDATRCTDEKLQFLLFLITFVIFWSISAVQSLPQMNKLDSALADRFNQKKAIHIKELRFNFFNSIKFVLVMFQNLTLL